MSIITSKTNGNVGFKKGIDKKSTSIALHTVQVSLYQYPIKSVIRETASNAYDSIKEREIAKNILSGKSKVTDYYQTVESTVKPGEDEEIYHSSGFDKDYYNIKYLSNDNQIYITYTESKVGDRDMLSIKDYGVGLGNERLRGFFEGYFSTKRLNKDLLGAFGLGSKSPLSTGIESFILESRYNGRLFRFEIFNDDVVSIIPKFSDEGKNEKHVFNDGNIYYSELTTEKNGVTITFEAKKHRRSEYTQAVKTQLLYFDNLNYVVIDENGYSRTIDTKAEIVYEDDDIIISNNTEFSAPHVILGTEDTKIVYGKVDFQELELENKSGSIGLKLNLNDVSVTPNRENVIWNAKTRAAIIKKFNKVQATASRYISESLKNETDFLSWIRQVTAILNRSSVEYDYRQGTVIDKKAGTVAILKEIADLDDLNIEFTPDPSIKYVKDMAKFFREAALIRSIKIDYSGKVVRNSKDLDWSDFNKSIYKVEGALDNIKDAYIYSLEREFLTIKLKELPAEADSKVVKDYNNGIKVLNMILASNNIKNYEDVEVPEDKQEALAKDSKSVMSPAEKRKILNQIVYYTLKSDNEITYIKSKRENTLKELEDAKSTYIYGNNDDVLKLEMIQSVVDNSNINKTLVPIKIAKKLNKSFEELDNAISVNDYIYGYVKNDTFFFPEELSNYIYGCTVKNKIEIDYKFLFNYASIDPEMQKSYKDLLQTSENYVKHFNTIAVSEIKHDELFENLLNLQLEFDKDNTINIKEKLIEINPIYSKIIKEDIKDIQIMNLNNLYNKLKSISEYADPIKVMLNSIPNFRCSTQISKELINSVKEYVQFKLN